MTIVKLLRKAALTILSACLVLSLVSCAKDKEEFPFEILPDETVQSNKNEISLYRIVVPSGCSAELLSAAEAFALRLRQQTHVDTDVIYDNEKASHSDNTWEISLGYTNRSLSSRLLKKLKKDDYLCRTEGNATVIGGKSEGATVAAMERFEREMLSGANSQALTHQDAGFVFEAEYAIYEVRLNGFLLSEYQLVVSDRNSDALYDVAETLREKIADRSGYFLDIIYGDEYNEAGRRIFLGERTEYAEEALAYIVPDGHGIIFRAETVFGMSVAARNLYDMIFKDLEKGSCTCVVTAAKEVPYEETDFRVASMAIAPTEQLIEPEKLQKAIAPIESNQPDAVLLNKTNWEEQFYLSLNLWEYTYAGANEQNGGNTLVAYAKEGVVENELRAMGDDSGLSVNTCTIGTDTNGFLLIHIGGRLFSNTTLTLPENINEENLPVVVLVHVQNSGGVLSLDGAFLEKQEVGAVFGEEYSSSGLTYSLACYASADALAVARGNVWTENGYCDVVVQRVSAFN